MTKNRNNLSEHKKDTKTIPKKKESKVLTVKEKVIRGAFLAAGVYLAGEVATSRLFDHDDDTMQFSLQKNANNCHLSTHNTTKDMVGVYTETNNEYTWKMPAMIDDTVSRSGSVKEYSFHNQLVVNPTTGKVLRATHHVETSSNTSYSQDTGIVSDPNNTVLQQCVMERKLNSPWCESGINLWHFCSPTEKTRMEVRGIIDSGILLGNNNPTVLWGYNLIEALGKNPSKNQEVRLKQGEAIYRATTQNGLSLGELVQLPKEYQALEKVKLSIAFLKKQFHEHANDGKLSQEERERIEFYKQVKILDVKEADELLETNEKEKEKERRRIEEVINSSPEFRRTIENLIRHYTH